MKTNILSDDDENEAKNNFNFSHTDLDSTFPFSSLILKN